MQLRVARLCMDCEELHDQQICPVCASETFAYVSRWVPAPERRASPRSDQNGADQDGAKPSTGRGRKVAYGALGLALAGVAGWWWKASQRLEAAAESGAGELR
ncbi:MAG: hypothetical protein AB7P99_07065 [Vicinamibacterales bacterium]